MHIIHIWIFVWYEVEFLGPWELIPIHIVVLECWFVVVFGFNNQVLIILLDLQLDVGMIIFMWSIALVNHKMLY